MDCTEDYAAGTDVELTAAAGADSTFAGWGGACDGEATNVCTVTMDQAQTVTATFDEAAAGPFALDVTVAGSGEGTVTSDPPGIDCGLDCTEDFAAGTDVELTATAGVDSTFSSWGGACAGITGTTCTVTMDAAASVTANFIADTDITTTTYSVQASTDDAEEFTSDVSADFPTGSVQVTSSDLDLNYDGSFNSGTVVGLRFPGVDIPQGATINAANLTLTADEAGAGTVTFSIVGDDTDDAQAFSNGGAGVATFGITGRAATDASATWMSDTTWTVDTTVDSPDLSAIIQEIVDRGGWTSGNALVLVIRSDDSDASNFRVAESYDGDPADAAELTVSYFVP